MTTANLEQLAYISRRKPWVSDEEVVDGIVLPAMAKNRLLGLTGCLWFNRERFLQVLEGAAAELGSMYERIVRDKRHDRVELLGRHAIEERSFARFNMRSFAGTAPESVAMLFRDHQDRPRRRWWPARRSSQRRPMLPVVIAELARVPAA